jgi:hypothetical protein
MKDFYYILGTDEKSTTLEIKEAYRKLSKKFHPDLNFNDKYFEKHFREVKEAYETLIDPDKRIAYDIKLSKFKADPTYDQYAEDLKHREDELRQREEKIKFRQAYPHYHRNSRTRTTNNNNNNNIKKPIPPGRKSKTRKVDIGFTLVLILITLIFGNYVMKVVSGAKKTLITNRTPIMPADVAFTPVSHKRKHKPVVVSNQDEANYTSAEDKPKDKVIADDYKSAVAENKAEAAANNSTNKVPVVIDDDQPPPADNTDEQPAVVSYKTPVPKNNFLYATNIVSNVTGVTNMRKTDRYGSAIIKEIPTNSRVLVIQKGDVFYKVLCDNYTGYVPKWALETK